MAIVAFGVPVFNEDGKAKNPPKIIGEINQKLEQMGIPCQNVINIQAELEYYHVFYVTT